MDIVRNDVDRHLIGIHTQIEMEDTQVNTIYGKISEGENICVYQIKPLLQERLRSLRFELLKFTECACIDIASKHLLKNFCRRLKN